MLYNQVIDLYIIIIYNNNMQGDISALIRKRRRDCGISLADLARRVGTSAATLSKYERGWRRFELYTLEKIATALGCRVKVSFEPLHRRFGTKNTSSAIAQLKRLFWDQKLGKRDFTKHPVWVAERVLEYGSLQDVHLLISFMGKKRFYRCASQCRFHSRKTANFWKSILSQENIPCTKKSYPRRQWLS